MATRLTSYFRRLFLGSAKPKGRLGERLRQPPSASVVETYHRYSREYSQEKCLEQQALVTACFREQISNPQLCAELIRERIEQQTPFSLVRLGDGEGNVLFHKWGKYPDLSDYCRGKISETHFGTAASLARHGDAIADLLCEAINQADMIGLHSKERLISSFDVGSTPAMIRGACGMRGVYNYLFEELHLEILAEKIAVSADIHKRLLPFYFPIMRDMNYLGVVACYDEIAPLLQANTGITRVELIKVPTQARYAGALRKEASRHYPEVFHRVAAAIRPPYEGAVYLVAAGLLAKPYCRIIKERGGIALDIGSAVDIWMGKRTRPSSSARTIEMWRLT